MENPPGDETAWTSLSEDDIREHAGWLRALAGTLVCDEATAQDVVQETWLRAVETPPRSQGSMRGWLRVVASSLAFKEYRGRQRRRRREAVGLRSRQPVPPAEEALAHAETLRVLSQAVVELDEPLRSTVVLRFFQELSSRDVARRLDIDVTTVRWRLRKALDSLRATLDQEHGEDRGMWLAALAPLAPLTPTPAGNATVAEGVVKSTSVGGLAVAGAAGAGLILLLALGLSPSPGEKPVSDGPADLPHLTTVSLPTLSRPAHPTLAEGLQVGPVPDGAVLVHILISEGDRWIVADSHRVLLSGVPAPPVRRVYPTRTGGLDYTLTTSGARAVRRGAEVVLEVQGTVAWRIGGGGNLWNGFGGASGTVSLSGWSGSSMKVGGDKGFRYRLFKFVTPIQPEDPLAPAPLPELLGLYEAVLERHSAFQHPAWRALASQFAEVRPTLPPVPGREPVVVPAGERFPRRISRVIVHDREALARIPESTHIQSLVILDPEFSDRHLAKLRGRNATENVDLRETTVRGPGLAVLRGFLGLRALVLPAALSRDAADEHLAPKCRSALGPGLLRDREATSFLDALAVAQADIEATVGKVELVELRFGGNGSKMTGGFFQKQRLDYRTAKLLIHGGRGSTEIQIRLERVGQARDWSVAELDLVPLSR